MTITGQWKISAGKHCLVLEDLHPSIHSSFLSPFSLTPLLWILLEIIIFFLECYFTRVVWPSKSFQSKCEQTTLRSSAFSVAPPLAFTRRRCSAASRSINCWFSFIMMDVQGTHEGSEGSQFFWCIVTQPPSACWTHHGWQITASWRELRLRPWHGQIFCDQRCLWQWAWRI